MDQVAYGIRIFIELMCLYTGAVIWIIFIGLMLHSLLTGHKRRKDARKAYDKEVDSWKKGY